MLHGKRNFLVTLVSAVLVFALLLPVVSADLPDDKILFQAGFESGDLRGFYCLHTDPEVVDVSDCPVGSGNKAVRFHLTPDSRVRHKSMLLLQSSDQASYDGEHRVFEFERGKIYWFHISIFIPDGWEQDTVGELLWQIQAMPDSEEIYRSPLLALYLPEESRADAGYQVVIRGDTNETTKDNSFTHYRSYWYPIEQDIGKWVDWVVQARWDWRENKDPFVNVWHNGELIVEDTGVNASNDHSGMYPSAGVYKWDWSVGKIGEVREREYYMDSFIIGNSNASYEDMFPEDPDTVLRPVPPEPVPSPKDSDQESVTDFYIPLVLK